MNEFTILTEEENYTVEIWTDDNVNPRKDWDQMATMYAFHSRYDLGDVHKHGYTDPNDAIYGIVETNKEEFLEQLNKLAEKKLANYKVELIDGEYYSLKDEDGYVVQNFDLDEKDEIEDKKEEIKEEFVDGGWEDELTLPQKMELLQGSIFVHILPLYLYDHSGLAMRTSPFYEDSYGFDSGQVGFILIDNNTIKKEYGKVDEETIEKAYEMMKMEVKEYDQYLKGEIYGFTIDDSNGECVHSCGGFMDEDHMAQEIAGYVGREFLEEIKKNI